MTGAERRIATIAERRAEAAADRLAAALDAIPGVEATRNTGGVAIRGRGLRRRTIADSRLRWPGELLR